MNLTTKFHRLTKTFNEYYNIILQGHGVRQSDEEAERWWLRAGEGRGVSGEEGEQGGGEGGRESMVRAQNTLGMFYSRQETLDLKKVYTLRTQQPTRGGKNN